MLVQSNRYSEHIVDAHHLLDQSISDQLTYCHGLAQYHILTNGTAVHLQIIVNSVQCADLPHHKQ